MNICFHKWGKWEQYEQTYYVVHRRLPDKPYGEKEMRQRRKCLKCNKMQDEKVYGSL